MSKIDTVDVGELATTVAVLTLKTTNTVEDALALFARRKITAAPVVDAENGQVWGWIDTVDCVALLAKLAREAKAAGGDAGAAAAAADSSDGSDLTAADLEGLRARAKEFRLATLDTVVDLSRHNAYYPVQKNQKMTSAVTLLRKGVHRLAVTDETHSLVGVLTQANLIHWLAKDAANIPPMRGSAKLSQVAKMYKPTVAVKEDATTNAAFSALNKLGHAGVPIVDASGKLVDVLRATDAAHIATEHVTLSDLLKPVGEFAKSAHGDKGAPIFTAAADSTVAEAISTMSSNRCHRVFIVNDKDGSLEGVVTMTDILRAVFD